MTTNVNQQALEDDAFPDELRPGTELLHGQYVIEKFLNSGGFGITYLAKDSLDRTVVIKECFPGSFCRRTDTIVAVRSRAHQNEFQSIVKLFVQEAKNLAKLKHPNIVGVHQIFEDNDTAYMALDYVDGRDLLDILEDPNDGLTPSEVQSMTQKLLGAVEYIHKAGVLHRDISPDNILINRNTGEPVLIDFGAAREEATRQTRLLSAMRVVKDGYSPQEFYIQGSQQSPSSDLYALGATLYHVITGDCPPDSQSRLAAVAAQKPDPFRAFPPELAGYDPKFLKAINQAMNIFPYDRIQSAAEWLKFVTPEPEIVALPTNAKPVRPKRPTSVIADDRDLADHTGGSASGTSVEPPVPAMVPAQQLESQPKDPGEDLSALRESASEPAKKKGGMGLMLGGVAAAALIGAVGAVFVLPEGTLTGGALPEVQTPKPVETTQVAPTTEPALEVAETAPATAIVEEPQFAGVPIEGDDNPAFTLEQTEPVATLTLPEETLAPEVNSEPTQELDVAALPAINLPLEAADEVSTVENEIQTPILSLEDAARLVSANQEAASMADQVEQAIVAAISPPKAPLTEAPEMLETISVSEPAPQIFAFIEPDESRSERYLSLLQTDPVSDAVPEIDVATATPLPEPEPEATAEAEAPATVSAEFTQSIFAPVISIDESAAESTQTASVSSTASFAPSVPTEEEEVAVQATPSVAPQADVQPATQAIETSAVMTGWTFDIPFSGNGFRPNVVADVDAGAPAWLRDGMIIETVNGVGIETIAQVEEVIRATTSISTTGQAESISIGYRTSQNAPLIEREVTFAPAHNTILLNGFQFKTVLVDGEWQSIVEASPEQGANALRPGDRLVAYIPTNERLNRETTLSEIFQRELDNGTSQFSFAVNRDGQLWVASLGYTGGDAN